MRLSVRLLGLVLLDVSLDTDPSLREPEVERATDCITNPVGFVARVDVPDMIDIPDRGA